MARADTLESTTADNAHLPTVSVFIVLLAMMAALTSYTVPSKNNFKAAKLSLVDTFSAPEIGKNIKKKSLPLWLTQQLDQLCTDFGATCRVTSSPAVDGMALLFGKSTFDATLLGLSPKEQTFIADLAAICANKPLRLTISLPFDVRLDAANILVLADLFQDGASDEFEVAITQADQLQEIPSLGFIVEPKAAAS